MLEFIPYEAIQIPIFNRFTDFFQGLPMQRSKRRKTIVYLPNCANITQAVFAFVTPVDHFYHHQGDGELPVFQCYTAIPALSNR